MFFVVVVFKKFFSLTNHGQFPEARRLSWLCMQSTNTPHTPLPRHPFPLLCLNNYRTHDAPQSTRHNPPLSDMQEGQTCTLWLHVLTVELVAMAKINRSLNLHLAPPSSHLKPPSPSPDPMTFVSLGVPFDTPRHLTRENDHIQAKGAASH